MFERFTERAREVVVLAQDEARLLGHNYIGTEHILLGLLREEEGIAARVLGSLDVSLEEVRDQVSRIVGKGDEITSGQIPFTPRAKKVLELSLREALGLGHNYIGTEHVLLGLVEENEGVAARVLLDFGADADKIRQAVLAALGVPEDPGSKLQLRRWRRQKSTVEQVVQLHRPTWQYRVEEAKELSAEILNQHGAEGWELVAVLGEPGAYRLVLRRPGR